MVKMEVETDTVNVIDAAASGALTGLRLAANVGAMLLAFVALVALVDFLLLKMSTPLAGFIPALEELSLSRIFGWIFAPLAWLIGVPWKDVTEVGGLIGTKVAVNEFLAYIQLNPILMLVMLLGLSLVKAALIIGYFMHMKFEHMNLVLTIIPAMIFCILLLNVFFPDAMRLKSHGVNRTLNGPSGSSAPSGH